MTMQAIAAILVAALHVHAFLAWQGRVRLDASAFGCKALLELDTRAAGHATHE